MKRDSNKKLTILQKAELLIKIASKDNIEEFISILSPSQLKELRDFLEIELLYLSSLNNSFLKRESIKAKYPSIPDYYSRYDCRESLDSCYNETCLASNPNCFSRKMKEQIQISLEMLSEYLGKEKTQEAEFLGI